MRGAWILFIILLLLPVASALEKDRQRVIITPNKELSKANVFSTMAKSSALAKIPKKEKFKLIEAYTADVTSKELSDLKRDPSINVEPDLPVYAYLDDSAKQVNATQTWNLSYNGENITGTGQTVCVIDSGVDYTHPALGNCTVQTTQLNGTIESYNLSSPHPYSNSTVYNYTITKTGYENIAVHFERMEVESGYDYIWVYDSNNNLVANYTGDRTDTWTPSVPGDTLHINLTTDVYVSDWGFKINATINGTTNTTYNWDNCTNTLGGIDLVNEDMDPMDDQGHGTHVSGIVASTDPTYRGVAFNSGVASVKALNSAGSGSTSDIIDGIEWCIDHKDDYNITAISMSLGNRQNHTDYCDTLPLYSATKQVVDLAVENGIAVIAASGNNKSGLGPGGISGPACLRNVTAVGAVDKDDSSSSYSQVGTILDFLAPGTNIQSTKLGGGFHSLSGTSMATPHVAAAYALLRQAGMAKFNRTLSLEEVYQALNDTGKTIDDNGYLKPRIDIHSAVLLALDNQAPMLNITAPIDNLSTHSLEQEFNLTADEELEWAKIEIDSINYTMQGSDKNWNYNHSFNTTGNYTYTAYGEDSAGNTGSTSIRNLYITNNLSITSMYPNTTTPFIVEPQNQTFNITIHDPENDTVNISWYMNGALQSSGIDLFEYNLSGSYESAGNYTITVLVGDGYEVVNNTWNLTINNTNRPPTIDSYNPAQNLSIAEPQNQTFNLTYNDLDNDTLTIQWLVNENTTAYNVTEYNFTSSYQSAGNYTIIVLVSDPYTSVNNTWNLQVNNTDTLPNITSYHPNSTNITMYENSTQFFNHSSTDMDGDNLTYNWTLDNIQMSNNSTFNYSADFNSSGVKNITLTVSDTQGNKDSNYWNLTVINVNRKPYWNDMRNFSIREDGNITYELNASDPDNDNITFTANNTDVNITNNTLSYQPTNFSGRFTITLAALDNESNTTAEMTITVNNPPSFTSTIPDFEWDEDNSKSSAFDLDDYFTDTQNLTYNYTGNNNIVVAISSENLVSFSQPSGWTGIEKVQFYASDAFNTTYSNNVSLKVMEVSSGGGGGGGSSYIPPPAPADEESKTWTKIEAGQTEKLSITKKELAVKEITFKANKELSNTEIKVKKITAPDTEKPFNKKAYNYIDITKNIEDTDLEEATISFEVEKEWAFNNSLSAYQVSLYRYTDEWVELNTTYTDSNSTHFKYNSTTPGFSYFAIGEKTVEEEEVDNTDISGDENISDGNINDSNDDDNISGLQLNNESVDNNNNNNSENNIHFSPQIILFIALIIVFLALLLYLHFK